MNLKTIFAFITGSALLALPLHAEEQENLGDFLTHHISNSHEWNPIGFLPAIPLPLGWNVFGIDMGISEHVLMMLIAAVLLLIIFASASRRKNGAPVSKLGHAME